MNESDSDLKIRSMSTEDIISTMTLMNSKSPGSFFGFWGASSHYQTLYKELIRRNYEGELPPQIYSPPPAKKPGK